MGNKTKTYAGKRIIPIPDFLYPYIVEQMQIATNQKNNDEQLLFKPQNCKYVRHSNENNELKRILKKEFNRIKKKYPDKVEKIKEHLDQIHYLEKSHCLDLDEVAGHFGHIMASICVYQEDVFKDDLYQMGFYLGKFIYLIDAFEDVEEDIKKQTYNPFKNKFKEEHFQEYCFNILEMMISRSSFYFEKLPLIENVELLRNIIYSGIWTKFELIKKKRMEEKS